MFTLFTRFMYNDGYPSEFLNNNMMLYDARQSQFGFLTDSYSYTKPTSDVLVHTPYARLESSTLHLRRTISTS